MSYLNRFREKLGEISLNRFMIFVSKASLTGFIYILSKESDFFILLNARKKILIFSILLFYLSEDIVDYIYNSSKSIVNSAIIIFIILRYSTVVPESRIDRFHIFIRTYLVSFVFILILNIFYKLLLKLNEDRLATGFYSFLKDKDYIAKPVIFVAFIMISFTPFIMNNLYSILGLIFSLILAFILAYFLARLLSLNSLSRLFVALGLALVFSSIFIKFIRPSFI